jgi:hypothetical protein
MAVAVPKLWAIHGDASCVHCVWQQWRFVAPWIGKNPIFSLLNTTIYLMPVFGGKMSFTNWVQEQRGSNTYCRQRTMDMMKWLTSLGSSRSSTTTCRWKSRKPCYTSTSSARRPYLIRRSESGSIQCIGRLSSCLKGMRSLVGGVDFLPCRTSHNAILRGANCWSLGNRGSMRGGWLRAAEHAGGDMNTRCLQRHSLTCHNHGLEDIRFIMLVLIWWCWTMDVLYDIVLWHTIGATLLLYIISINCCHPDAKSQVS